MMDLVIWASRDLDVHILGKTPEKGNIKIDVSIINLIINDCPQNYKSVYCIANKITATQTFYTY